jgi:hypothetical protein
VYTAGEALLSDSTPEGSRSKVLTKKQQVQSLGTCLGPLVALCMFAGLGNEWTKEDCAWVILAGQAAALPALLQLCRMSDDRAAADEGEEDAQKGLLDVTAEEAAEEERDESTDRSSARSSASRPPPSPYSRRVPITIAIADLISGLASGMSIRFFPIFFYDTLDLSPVTVQVLYIISPLSIVYLSKLARSLSVKHKRCQTHVFFKWVGVSMMSAMLLACVVAGARARPRVGFDEAADCSLLLAQVPLRPPEARHSDLLPRPHGVHELRQGFDHVANVSPTPFPSFCTERAHH